MEANNENFISHLELNELNNVFFRELHSIRILSGKGGLAYGCRTKNLN